MSEIDKIKKLQKFFGKHELRIAGGAVRDFIMGVEPKDWDICTTATPETMISIAKKNKIRYIPTGVKHGTITFLFQGSQYEITTLRVDVECDGRHAKVRYTDDWYADAARRDLTINSVMMKLDGSLVDPFNGINDIENEYINFVGDPDKRIKEDYLRILRFYRFASKFENPIFDQQSLDAIAQNNSGLENISGERIWSELKKILSSKSANHILKFMNDFGTLKELGIPYKEIPENVESPSIAIAHLFDDRASLEDFISTMKMSWNEIDLLGYVFNRKNKIVNNTYFINEIVINHIDKNMVREYSKYMLNKEFDVDSVPKFIVDGNDLIREGYKPGPDFNKMIYKMKSLWIASDFTMTKSQLLESLK